MKNDISPDKGMPQKKKKYFKIHQRRNFRKHKKKKRREDLIKLKKILALQRTKHREAHSMQE